MKEPLRIHELVRRQNEKGEYIISFFKVANEEETFYVQWCGDSNEEAGNIDNDCSKCNNVYCNRKVWLCCSALHVAGDFMMSVFMNSTP